MVTDPLALCQLASIRTAWHRLYEGQIPKTCEGADPARSSAWDPGNGGGLVHSWCKEPGLKVEGPGTIGFPESFQGLLSRGDRI